VKVCVDMNAAIVSVEDADGYRTLPLASAEAFEVVSDVWLRAGWDVKHVYSFTWLGRPIIQLPEDMFRLQEVIHHVRPDVIVETGIAHGGSLIFHAGLCRLMAHGRVIGVDVEIRPANRGAIEQHPLADLITLIEGDSTTTSTVAKVKAAVRPGESAMVLLDSAHGKVHVLTELDAYAPLVGLGSYIVAMDGIMGRLVGAPRAQPDWDRNNPREAVREWVARNPQFALEEPGFAFNEGLARRRVTYWPDAFLRRVS
jgi:cephalosporin hydroxylase